MNKYSSLLVWGILLLTLSCSSISEQDVFIFDPSKDYPEFPLSLNDVADVSFITLGGEEEGIYIPSIWDAGFFFDGQHNRLFTSHSSIGVLEFDGQGRFLRRIGRLGRGPGEYATVFFYIQPETERVGVYDQTREKFLVYKYDGSYIEGEGIDIELFAGFNTFLVHNDCLLDYNPYSTTFLESSGRTHRISERTLNLFPIFGQNNNYIIKDIHYEQPLVIPEDWGEDYHKLMLPGQIIPSYSGILLSTYRSDTTYVIENDFRWRPFLVNERHNGIQEGCLYPTAETKDYLFLCHQDNLRGGRSQLQYYAIDKKSKQHYKITSDESSLLPGPLQGKAQIPVGGITKNPEYRFWEFRAEDLKEECYDYLPQDLKVLVDQCDEDSNPILMLIKFKDVTHN